eukprot:TRINITY_DN7563_c0_g1_i1.p1 TRINITY_DN7563_c0_g1~~TRINITY_DN7563_c0_g1_i1.p1  ORF type:complete len:478 (-),score=63.94 TRINITY_DN7563_c0_g1_i1:235-1668(-)
MSLDLILPDSSARHILAQFRSTTGDTTGPQLDLPVDITPEQLELLLNDLLKNEESFPYSFFVKDSEVLDSLQKVLESKPDSTEETIEIVYLPQSVFRVRPITRCSGSLSGHSEAVLSVHFSPDGSRLASGSGDATVRIWDLNTKTPEFTCKGHCKWVLCVAWSPDGQKIASGSMDNCLRLWDAKTAKQQKTLTGHQKYITCISWEPLHLNGEVVNVATGSKDGTVRVWDTRSGRTSQVLSGHTMSVTSVRWGGEGLIYSASQDRSIIAHDPNSGKQVKKLDGHAHWVNTLSLSTDYVLRSGAFDPMKPNVPTNTNEAKKVALELWQKAKGEENERLASGSDDHTIILWNPSQSKKPINRMAGHQQPVNFVLFSPNGRLIGSASFDKSVRLWDGFTGNFLTAFRAHVGAVYQISWSPDSRMLVSASRDSTLKVWDIANKKLKLELPGHADEIYAVDWSPDGVSVASGSKDRIVKIWCH